MGFEIRAKEQAGWGASPWSLPERIRMALWHAAWLLLFRTSPKPMNAWRVWLLKLFGARISGRPYLSSSAIVRIPWQLTMEDKATLGERAEVYNLGHVTLRERATVAQHGYVCGGTHDLEHPDLLLMVGDIEIGADVFIGVRAIVLPGVVIGAGAVIGAGSVVTRDIPEWTIGAGNPWRPIRARRRPGAGLPHDGAVSASAGP